MPFSFSSIAVFCGSNSGVDPAFGEAAVSLGRLLAASHIRLVYGGGCVGLMGVLADATLANGGDVYGVITRALEMKEVAHAGLTSLDVVETMHERKAAMADQADAFIMLPGGFGTLDEFFEVLTWTQLGIHSKPCGLLNVNGFFDPLISFFDTAAAQRFIKTEYWDLVVVESDPRLLVDRLRSWKPVTTEKWLDRNDR
jgi:uncharacterized protein (TIGR00730 family)